MVETDDLILNAVETERFRVYPEKSNARSNLVPDVLKRATPTELKCRFCGKVYVHQQKEAPPLTCTSCALAMEILGELTPEAAANLYWEITHK